MGHEVWEITEPWYLRTLWFCGCVSQYHPTYSDTGKFRVIIWLLLIIYVPTDGELVKEWGYFVSLEFFSWKLVNSNKYLFISTSLLGTLLIQISIPEFDWPWDSAKLVFELLKQSETLKLHKFTKVTHSFWGFFETRWLFLTHLSYAHTFLLEESTIAIDVLNLNDLLW